MTEYTFWTLIEDARSQSTSIDELVDALQVKLESKPRADAVAFQRALNAVMVRAYRWDLIGAACFLGCGQSDDGFEDFRAWLVAQGKETFESVLRDVNVLGEFQYEESPTEEWHAEQLHMLPGLVGGEESDPDWPYRRDPEEPAGEPLTLELTNLRHTFPKLWARFGSEFMIGID